jgi:hypothetical protein
VGDFTLSPKIRNGYPRGVNAQLSFDTLAFVKRLSAAGMDSRQAEVLAEALNEIVFDKLATRSDLKETELGLRSDLKEMEARLRAELKELEARLRAELKELELRLTNSLTGRMGAMTAATVAVLGALVTLT